MCAFQVTQVDIPDEVMGAGFKFESYCCIKFNTESKGMMTMCNVNKPRCWQDIRAFGRLMRKICLQDHLTKAGLPVEPGLAKEKQGGSGDAANGEDTDSAGDEIKEQKDVYEISADSLKTMGAVSLVSDKNTASTVLRLIEVKKVNEKWIIQLSDAPPADSAAPATPPATTDDDVNLQEAEVNTIRIINLY